METLRFASFQAHIALFSSISPSSLSSLRQSILDASLLPSADSPECTPAAHAQREAVNFAFINPRLITSKLHLQTAIYQAVLAETENALRTKTVHSEILWALNPTNNISEAIRRYGLPSPANSISTASPREGASLLVIRVCGPDLQAGKVQENMSRVVEGTLMPLDTLLSLTDWATIKKFHKLNNESWITNDVVDNIVTSTAAMKSVAS
ncbi:hypothetical protein APHAL10511_008664 [Amanita phalloides]|nr:hypothetical protein APHAL10511_008664 [Amanita phalloides]